MAALARKSADDPRFADRVELYAGGLELANGFAELSDPIEQRARFEEEKALRASLGKPTWGIDERFLAALPGMGNAAGIAFGVDRFVMLLTGATSINDVLPASARERFSFRE
jgi:lysyl-tRNA synthetase class 2